MFKTSLRRVSIKQANPATGSFAPRARRDKLYPGVVDRVDHLLQAIYDRAHDAVAGLHPLDGRQGDAGEARQFLLVDSKKGASGLHLRTGDHWSIYNDGLSIIKRCPELVA